MQQLYSAAAAFGLMLSMLAQLLFGSCLVHQGAPGAKIDRSFKANIESAGFASSVMGSASA
jgi:hypothetical protein